LAVALAILTVLAVHVAATLEAPAPKALQIASRR
jgi:hypothetical protein